MAITAFSGSQAQIASLKKLREEIVANPFNRGLLKLCQNNY